MTNTLEEFRDVLDAEDEVDVQKLCDMAQHGVPPSVRGVVWKYLLGVTVPRKCELLRRPPPQTATTCMRLVQFTRARVCVCVCSNVPSIPSLVVLSTTQPKRFNCANRWWTSTRSCANPMCSCKTKSTVVLRVLRVRIVSTQKKKTNSNSLYSVIVLFWKNKTKQNKTTTQNVLLLLSNTTHCWQQ